MTGHSPNPVESGEGTALQRVDYTVLYVMGVGHSGSTLLNLLLNAHSRAVGLSELHFMKRYLELPKEDVSQPLSHRLWRDVAECWEARTGINFRDIRIETPARRRRNAWSSDELSVYREHNRVLFDCIAEISGAEVLVDSSKSLSRLRLLVECGLPLKVVHLVRDGRGVVNSYRRKYGTFSSGFRRWLFRALLGPWTRLRLSGTQFMLLRYEDLANAPELSLKKVCAFAGLEYEPTMLEYWKADDISVGGNRMRQEKRPIRLDEKWRRELSSLDLAAFAIAGSWLNRMYGYPLLGKYQPAGDVHPVA